MILAALNVLRSYVHEKFPQYLPDMTIVKSLPEKIIIMIMVIFASLYLVVIMLILPKWYSSLRYVIGNGKITAYAGLITRTYSIMRISSIQHASVVSTPLSKYTSFNFITLSALGGNIMMLFLSDEDCKEILKLIRDYKSPVHQPYTVPDERPSFDGYDLELPERTDDDRQTSMFDTATQLSFYDIDERP